MQTPFCGVNHKGLSLALFSEILTGTAREWVGGVVDLGKVDRSPGMGTLSVPPPAEGPDPSGMKRGSPSPAPLRGARWFQARVPIFA